jgi:hypothetical protein
MCIEFAPPPDLNYEFAVTYYAMPRQRTLTTEYTTGTVSVVGTAVTGTNTTFTQAMVGCQLRQGTANSGPVGDTGATGSLYENTIQIVTDATHLTLSTPGTALGAVQFVIDDPIDVERMSMDEVFCRMCESQFYKLTRADARSQAFKEEQVAQSLRVARARDVRKMPNTQRRLPPSFESLAYANLGGR